MSLKLPAPGSRLSTGTRTDSSRMSACQTARAEPCARSPRRHSRACPSRRGTRSPGRPRRAPRRRSRPRSSRCRSSAWRRRARIRRRSAAPWSRGRPRPSVLGFGEGERADLSTEPWTAASVPSASEPSIAIDFMARPDCTPRKVPRLPSLIQLHVDQAARDQAHRGTAVALDVVAGDSQAGQLPDQSHGNSARSQYSAITGKHLAVHEAARLDEAGRTARP